MTLNGRIKLFFKEQKKASDAEDLLDITPSSSSQVETGENDENEIITPVIGTEVIALVANLSGCSAHQEAPDCSSNICFHRK